MDYTLFPPIIESKMPAFLRTESCKVYFALSQYNNVTDIKNCQVKVTYQNNNSPALNSSTYPSGIKLCNLSTDNTVKGDAKYYITISPSDLQNNIFLISQYYKIQIRFTSTSATSIDINTTVGIDSWLANNLPYFSEWSDICLIKAISQPYLNVFDFNRNNDYIQTIISNYYTVNLDGVIIFADAYDTQYIRSFKVVILENSKKIYESDEIYAGPQRNRIKHSVTFESKISSYQYIIYFTTNNFYKFNETFTINIDATEASDSNLKIQIYPDEQNGRMKINIKNITNSSYIGNIIIKRASGKKDFTDWTTVHVKYIDTKDTLDYIWYDTTIQSGELYMYGVQEAFLTGDKTKLIICQNPKMAVFQHMYLFDGKRQLNIKFDPQVASFQKVLSEVRVETIGSKYPWFYKTGSIDYKTFSISGTISALMDDSALMKASKEELYGDKKRWYDDYNEDNKITPYNDYVYEKDFREEVIKFLYQNNVKLFKSATEGNILVKLMDINFTPNTTLSRRIYSFTCTAYEIDEFNIQNCLKYNILNIDQINFNAEKIVITEYCLGQLYAPQRNFSYFTASNLVTNQIKNQNLGKQLPGYNLSIDHLSYLRIELSSKPYLIEFYNGNPRKISTKTTGASYASVLGHIVSINGNYIIIGQDGVYELRGNDDEQELSITDIVFENTMETGTIDYIACIKQTPITTNISTDRIFTYYNTVGQLWGEFNNQDSLYNKIYSKYDQIYTTNGVTYNTHLNKIDQMKIMAAPGTIIYVKQAQDTIPDKHIIGTNGTLLFDNKDTDIREIYFGGVHLDKAPLGAENAKQNEYIEYSIFIDNLNQIENPACNGVYTLSSSIPGTIGGRKFNKDQRYIYYKDNWYLFNQDDNITEITSADIIIDYHAIIYKGRG